MKINIYKYGAGVLLLLLAYSPAAFASTVVGLNITTAGTLSVDGALKFGNGASAGYSLISNDAAGNATWQALTKASVGLGNVENTALSTWPGSINITTLGNVTDNFSVVDTTDTTKALKFDVQGSTGIITTFVTNPTANRTLTAPDTSGTLLVSNDVTGQVFINSLTTDNGSNAGLQYSSTVANRGQVRLNQYGNNAGVPGVSTIKSRGASIGVLAPVQPGDVIFRDTAVGVTDNLTIPLSGLISITVAPNGVPAGQGWIATDYDLQLVPLAGPINGRKQAFRITSEGILHIKESANTMAGLATLDAAGQAVIANTQVTATTKFNLTIQDGGSIPSGFVYQSARVIGTSFTIKSSTGASDSGVQVYYQLWEPTTP